MRKAITWPVLIAALGYFVDMFDLTIFGVVRVGSLKDLGVSSAEAITSQGVWLVNLQAAGMLLGGVLWGVLGDKKGRLSVLFASIILYSVANALNAVVTNLWQYEALRFVAGIGLAGELGAAVTLVAESLTPEQRGYGTTLIAALGLLGAVAASLLGQMMPWRIAFAVGGALGFVLLAARFQMTDSPLFSKMGQHKTAGQLSLFLRKGRFVKYLLCIFAGVPIYFATGILFTFAPEISRDLGLEGVSAGNALLCGSIGLTLGDLASGLLSQWIKSRLRAIQIFLLAGSGFALLYFTASQGSTFVFYGICGGLGFCGGYWAVLVTMAAEQFGTNLRATVATSVPNFVRSAVIILSTAFLALKPDFGSAKSALIVGAVVLVLALTALFLLPESYGKNLDFLEIDES